MPPRLPRKRSAPAPSPAQASPTPANGNVTSAVASPFFSSSPGSDSESESSDVEASDSKKPKLSHGAPVSLMAKYGSKRALNSAASGTPAIIAAPVVAPIAPTPPVVAAASPVKTEPAAATITSPATSGTAAANVTNKPSDRASPTVLSFPSSLLAQPFTAYASHFDDLARNFLLNYDLISNGVRLHLREIELYFKSDAKHQHADLFAHGHPIQKHTSHQHADLFAHGHPIQKHSYGKWYWHRQGQREDAKYKGGNYKGLDVTFGPKIDHSDASDPYANIGGHGGILIRSIQRASDGVIIEGSCLVAEEVLRHHKATSIEEVVNSWKGNMCAFNNPTLYFAPKVAATPAASSIAGFTSSSTPAAAASTQPKIVRSPRVGLTLKQEGPTRPQFIMLPYRYSVLPFFNKKQKQTIVMSVYEELGSSQQDRICSLCDCTPAYLQKFAAAYESGKKMKSMDKFTEKKVAASMSAEDLAQMQGAWTNLFGTKPHVALLK